MTFLSKVEFRAYGQPAMQGSKTARVINGRAVMFEANKGFQAWRSIVVNAAKKAILDNQIIFTDPIRVELNFYLERPKTVKRELPSAKFDLDKLARLVNDALTISGLITDDGLICELVATKRYATETLRPGVFITIQQL
jgi:Holliday junction resolvase RusA-like endonuclease